MMSDEPTQRRSAASSTRNQAAGGSSRPRSAWRASRAARRSLTRSVPPGPGTGKVSGAGWNDPGQDRSGLWLRTAAAGLCVLAAAAAAVSFTAQYRMADAARHLPVVAALEAAIPDAAAPG